jgi:hypothetical protein
MYMSVREYIGARYVPVFADPIEWSNNRTFEPLTIVTYQGNSYTSRQFVPQGITIQDTNYWALTSNFNSQVESYRQEVQRLSGRVDVFDTDLAGETDDRIAGDNALGARIDSLGDDITTLEDLQFILIGDSWTAQGTGRLLAARIFQRLNMKTSKWFNVAVSGTGFLETNTTPTFPQQLDSVINNAKIDKNAPTIVCVLGGTNDFMRGFTDAQEYANVINDMQATINANFPHARTYFFFMQAYLGRTYPKALIRNVQSLTANRCNVINSAWPVARSGFADNGHLNEAGEKEFARFMLANMGVGSFGEQSATYNFKTEATSALGDVFGTCQLRQVWDERHVTSWLYISFPRNQDVNAVNGYIDNVEAPCLIHEASVVGKLWSFGGTDPFNAAIGYDSTHGNHIRLQNPIATATNNFSGSITEILA